MGMEVFTIASDAAAAGGGGGWREITALSINGFMFWRIGSQRRHIEQPPWALLHLSLEDEEFGITMLPDSLDLDIDDIFLLDVLHDRELCFTARTSDTTLTIWTLPVVEQGLNSLWQCRYSIQISSLF
ncbi:hypothetical protein U9M48_043584 [Paspalum notatum var. saurae]|uniref:Uncharacterized protein n=1 Tax=Paspalum notatum var. saurae TaxID=547442 RepID=A0AAQ3XFP6_PASNO